MSRLSDTVDRVRTIYCDLDQVLADFNGQVGALARFDNEVGFFENLLPISTNILAIEMFMSYGADVYILSASPNAQADSDKIKWLEKHLPDLPKDKIILCRLGEDKSKYVEDMNGALLFDDYTENLIKWKANGGLTIKVVGKGDNEIGKHTKHDIPYVNTLLELVG